MKILILRTFVALYLREVRQDTNCKRIRFMRHRKNGRGDGTVCHRDERITALTH